jgi:imidazolonepropionase-like amidohydrolase
MEALMVTHPSAATGTKQRTRQKRGGLVLALLAAPLIWLAAAPAVAGQAALAIVGATVVDGTGADPRPHTTILVAADRIIEVVPDEDANVPAEAHVVDATGKWVIPGLIDAHVHLFQSGGLYTRPDVIDLRHERPYEEELAWVQDQLADTFARYIASGVTGIVDMGGPMWTFDARKLAEELAGELDLAPRVAVAGPLLANRVPPKLAEVADPPMVAIYDPDQARAQVEAIAAHDPDMIKLWLIGPDDMILQSMDWVEAAIETSRAHDIPVVAHATTLSAAQAVVAAGADILAHSIRDRVMGEDLLRTLAERQVVYVTTLVVREGYGNVLSGEIELSAFERRLGHPEVIASWEALDQPRRLARQVPLPVEAENLRLAVRHGVIVAAGSDAGNIGTLPGPGLHRELELMVEAGLTPMETLQAATHGAAAAMRRSEELGRIVPGYLADLVILNADPTLDITNTRDIHRVVIGGKVVDPGEVALQ